MKLGACLIILCALLSSSLAEDMALRSGRVLKDASVVSSGDDFVSVQYTDGVAKVPYKELTDEQQKAYKMTPDDVAVRLEQRRREEAARKQKAEAAKKAAEEEARKMRESLSEAERHPRYLEGEDVVRMFLLVGDLSKVEAEVMALQWNALEADRVGLPQDARVFRARAATYQEQVKAIRKKREDAELYWKDMEKKYLALKDGTQKKIADLNKQVSQLQGEVKEVASQPKTERIIVSPVVRPWNYLPPPVIIRPTPPPPSRPHPVPPRPVPVPVGPNSRMGSERSPL